MLRYTDICMGTCIQSLHLSRDSVILDKKMQGACPLRILLAISFLIGISFSWGRLCNIFCHCFYLYLLSNVFDISCEAFGGGHIMSSLKTTYYIVVLVLAKLPPAYKDIEDIPRCYDHPHYSVIAPWSLTIKAPCIFMFN
jgi:hypothetical protein